MPARGTRGAPLLLGGALALLAAGAPRSSHPDRPPPGHTGGFGEPTCQACHFDGPLNDEGGSLTLAGVPAAYEPGERYRIRIVLVQPGTTRGGVQLSARFARGPREGRQAGRLRPVDGRAAVTENGEPAVSYAHHTPAGTQPVATDTVRWTLEWTAPETAGEGVVFHAAANAADDDASPLGDRIYTTSARSEPRARPSRIDLP